MLFLVIATVLTQTNQSEPLPAECFEKMTRDVAMNTLQLAQKLNAEFTELSGTREGDAQLARRIVFAMGPLLGGLGLFSTALAIRPHLRGGQASANESTVRMGLILLRMGLGQIRPALTAARGSTRTYQLEQVKLLSAGLDELDVFVGPCIEPR